MAYWLVKSEPETYGIDHLKQDKKTDWTGVRSYAARNFLRAMSKGDEVLYYHSMSKESNGVVGLAKVTKTAFVDSTAEEGDWSAVELAFVKKFSNAVPLSELKTMPMLKDLKLLKIPRLSVMPVTDKEFEAIVKATEK